MVIDKPTKLLKLQNNNSCTKACQFYLLRKIIVDQMTIWTTETKYSKLGNDISLSVEGM